MKIVKIERLYKDKYASLRDYQVRKAIEKDTPIKVELEGSEEYMILRPIQLKKGVSSPKVYVSSFVPAEGEEPLEYKLMDFMWKPTTIAEEEKKDRLIAKLGEEWFDKVGDQFNQPYMKELGSFLSLRRTQTRVLPDNDNVFKAFKLTSYNDIRVVIIGQDPYHSICSDKVTSMANGLAFSSNEPFDIPPSLHNIFTEVERDVKNGLQILPDADLTRWATQGVLLLNTILTVDQGKPLSHEGKGWEQFTEHVIRTLNHHPKRLVWLLWGKKAQEYKKLIDIGYHLY
jgi:uracil-DNA glycosylase